MNLGEILQLKFFLSFILNFLFSLHSNGLNIFKITKKNLFGNLSFSNDNCGIFNFWII